MPQPQNVKFGNPLQQIQEENFHRGGGKGSKPPRKNPNTRIMREQQDPGFTMRSNG